MLYLFGSRNIRSYLIVSLSTVDHCIMQKTNIKPAWVMISIYNMRFNNLKKDRPQSHPRLGRVIPNRSMACVLHAPPFLGGRRIVVVPVVGGGFLAIIVFPGLAFLGGRVVTVVGGRVSTTTEAAGPSFLEGRVAAVVTPVGGDVSTTAATPDPSFLGGRGRALAGVVAGGVSTTDSTPLLLFAGFDGAADDETLAAALTRLSSTSLTRLPRTSPRSCSLDPVHSNSCTIAMPRSRFISRPSATSLSSPCQCPSPTKPPPSSYTMYFLLKVWNLSLPSCHLFFLRRRSCVYRQMNSRIDADANELGAFNGAAEPFTERDVDC